MKKTTLIHPIVTLCFLLFMAEGFAGGRYADPPPSLVEVTEASQQALDKLNSGSTEEAAVLADQAFKLASDSADLKSTAPMQKASARLRITRKALKDGNIDKARTTLAELTTYMNGVVESYKAEGKL